MASFKQKVESTLTSLLTGTKLPDVIYIFVPKQVRHFNISQVDILPSLLQLRDSTNNAQRRELVRVVHVDDFGGNTKLIPVLRLEHDPYTLLITVDDDVVYGKHFIKTFLQHASVRPGWSHHMACENFTRDGGLLRNSSYVKGPCMFGTGADGNCFRRWFFDVNVLEDLASAPPSCFVHDDIWIAGNLWRRDIPKFRIACGPKCVVTHSTSDQRQIHLENTARLDRNTCANHFDFLQPSRNRSAPQKKMVHIVDNT